MKPLAKETRIVTRPYNSGTVDTKRETAWYRVPAYYAEVNVSWRRVGLRPVALMFFSRWS